MVPAMKNPSAIKILYFDPWSGGKTLKPTPSMIALAGKMKGKTCKALVIHPSEARDIKKYLERGQLFAGKELVAACASGGCHKNSSAWYVLDPSGFRLATGWWCTPGNDAWTPHTWLLVRDPKGNDRVFDPTGEAVARFGYILDAREAEAHVHDELDDTDIDMIVTDLRPRAAEYFKKLSSAAAMKKTHALMAKFSERWARGR